jgi:anti-anti-sigma factor
VFAVAQTGVNKSVILRFRIRKKEKTMTFDREMMGDVLVLTPHKNLVGGDESNELMKAIDDIARGTPCKVVIDMGEISWVSSLGLGMMRKASITCDRSGGWLRLARIGKLIENSLLVTGLMIYFEAFDTVDLAVAAPVREAQRWSARPRPDQPAKGREAER